MKTSDFDYSLPRDFIAQTPIEPRDHSRLMVVDRGNKSLRHHSFFEIVDFLHAGDVLVFNNSRVIPARLSAGRAGGEGKLEILLLRQHSPGVWETLVRPGKRARIGTTIEISGDLAAGNGQALKITGKIIGLGERGVRVVEFSDGALLSRLGEVPLPPYIRTPLLTPERYQTVYASVDGSVAAPTAGLHFTPELIDEVKSKGVRCLFVTLHIGLDTFQPVREDDPHEHLIHQEYGVLGREAATELSQAKADGRRIICVGTTSVRLIEAAAQVSGPVGVLPFEGWVSLFIMPGYRFKAVDALITNFHLPRSTLLMLVSAFAGKDLLDQAYREAIAQRYRFYSFGDAMLVL